MCSYTNVVDTHVNRNTNVYVYVLYMCPLNKHSSRFVTCIIFVSMCMYVQYVILCCPYKVKEEASAEPPKDPKPVAKPPSKKATAGKKQAAAKPSSGKGKGKGGGATGVGEAPDPAEENITVSCL